MAQRASNNGNTMLRKFSVENYKNFCDKAVLDFTAVRDYSFSKDCIRNGLLDKAVLIGKNGSGKTNLGFALFDIVYTLTDNQSEIHQTDEQSFINGDSRGNEAAFCYEFQHGDSIIEYSYRKSSPFKITYEKLAVGGKTVFEIEDAKLTSLDAQLMSAIGAGDLQFSAYGGSLAFFRYVAHNTPQSPESPVYWITDFVRRMLYFRSVQDGNVYIGLTKGQESLDQYLIENNLVDDFQRFLNDTAGFEMKLSTVDTEAMPSIVVQRFRKKPVLLSAVASSGTKALELYYYWSRRFDDASFIFIDEFDAFYHYELAENMLRNVLKIRSAQIVLTTHNTGLVGNDLLRPDCYLMIDDGQIRSFSGSTGREIRKGHNLEKMLRKGEFDGGDNPVHNRSGERATIPEKNMS
ncbi:AAA family ATPase [Methanomassiliicoccales archaeon LGM-DZ1]|nr:AAA family ATPase [Methanomassiliicoccales archaeon LGM-DZ1]